MMDDLLGPELLREWLSRPGHSQRRLARLLADAGIRVGQQVISAWARGKSLPDDDKLAVLQRITGIPAAAWRTPEQIEAARVIVKSVRRIRSRRADCRAARAA